MLESMNLKRRYDKEQEDAAVARIRVVKRRGLFGTVDKCKAYLRDMFPDL